MGHLALQAGWLLLLATLGCWGRPDPGTSSCNAFQQAVCGKKCIPFTWLCNGEEECPDGSDEHCEVECRGDPNAWQCKDGKCIAASWFCDGTSDCMDRSDEENCVCAEKKVPCQDHVQCINPWEICDKHKDCADGSDEANCPTTDCLDGQWQCKNKVCVMEDWKCNGVDNCGDSSDEGNCAFCPQGMIGCDKGKCILGSLICNGVKDCLDGSDEPRTCGKNCSLDNGGCMKKCTDTYWGVKCSCDPGWNLQPDGQTCVDVDECALAYGPCSQLCKNTIGSFTCSCVKGYKLSRATTCEVADSATKILLASNQDLTFLDTKTLRVVPLVPTRTMPSSIAYDLLRRAYYWVDEGKRLHIQMPGKHEILLYPDVGAVNSISVDWFTGQLYWASNSPPAICAGLSDGRGYVKILEKKLMPEQLTVFPGKKYMYWVNRCKKGRTTIEGAGMDGSDRHLLAVATAEEPVGLTLDYVTGRLYWISAYKKSIETIKVDGTGRYTFPETMLRVQNPLGLAVFENQFFWADKEHLLSASCMSPDVSRILLNSSISSFTVLHELQQPHSDTLACAPGLCSHICLLSPVHPKGYKCACPDGTFLLPSGKCAELKMLFSTGMVIYLLQVSSDGIVLQHTPIQEWPVHIYFQDVDWNRGLIYWTDDEGELMRFNKETKAKVIIPTMMPVCLASVDVPSGDLYWLTCDRTEIKVTTFVGMMTKTLYHSKDNILHLFLDWQRASLYWLESGKPIQRMALDGSDVKVVWNETWTEDIPITLDISSSSFFWSSKDMVLKMLNLNTHKAYSLKERWTYGVAATYGPYLVTFNKTALVVWNRRSMEPSAVNILDVQKLVIVLDTNLETVQSVPVRNPVAASTTVLITGTAAAVLPKTTIHATTVPSTITSTTIPTTTTTSTTTTALTTAAPTATTAASTTTAPTTTTTASTTTAPTTTTTASTTTASTTTTTASTTTASTTTTTASKTTIVTPLVCGWAEVPCRNGIQCVSYDYVCDGEEDCADGSDEDDCVEFCSNPGIFKCQNGKCIHERHRCDGIMHCADGSDESDCWVPTPDCALRCDRNRCVPEMWLCDGTPDCFDSADEQGCAQKGCSQQEFQCTSGQCVSYSLRCDGDYDCKDHSDEEDCLFPIRCQGDEIKCDNGECIRKDWHCDGDMDCKDGSDEKDCQLPQLTCGRKQWRCNSARQCVPDLWRCDGEVDCKDGSDETGCEPRKCWGYEFQCGQTCINYTLVCNGRRDCQGGLDEGRTCDMPCRRSCSHICYQSPNGPKCACQPGYVLSRDRRTCRDINECKELANEEKCSQTCINTNGGYTCTCHPGYLLEPDGHTCKVVGSEPKLLVAVQFDLIIYGLRSMKEDVLFADRKLIIFSIDYDLVEQKIFWIDLNAESIKWLDMKTNQKGTLVKGIKSDSIAVDWIGRVLYWTDGSQGKLLATHLDGSWKGILDYTVVLDEDVGQPQSLALHPLDGLMYWSEIGSEPKIEQAGMDGSNRKTLINKELGWPTTITLDLLSWKIFWMDDRFHCIGSASLDGTGIKVFQLTEIHTPFSVSVFEDYIYWSEMKTRSVRRVDKRTGKNTEVIIKRHGQPHGLKLMHEVLQPRSSNPCASSGCSHLCLLNPNKGGSCRCPIGLVLSENEKTCIPMKESAFVFLVDQTQITRVYLKMLRFKAGQVTFPENSTRLLTNIAHLTMMDYSLRDSALYFSESSDEFIKMITFKDYGSASWKVVLPVEGTAVSLALDWLSGNIYWIDDERPNIHIASADRKYRYVVVSDGLYRPISVVLHPPSAAMCMIDLGTKNGLHGPKLECASMDGSKRRILWKKFQSPVGLTIVDAGTKLFWADQATGTVESIRIDGSQFRVVREGLHDLSLFTVGGGIMFWTTVAQNGLTKVWYSKLESRESSWFQAERNPVAIKIYSKLTQQGSNGCSENNGGCSHICLPVPQGRNCKCVPGYHLVRDSECIRALRCLMPLQACKDNSKCIPREHVCDGTADCLDGSDEANCTYIGKKPQSTVSSWTTQLQTKLLATVKLTTRKPMTLGHPTSTSPKTKLSTTQKWKQQTWTQEVVRSGLDSLPCSSETCNMRGECTVENNKVKCTCALGYTGDYCEEEANSAAGAIVLSTIGILLVSMVAAGAYIYLKKQQTRRRAPSTSSFRTLASYHKDIEPEAEGKFVEDETCINEAYDPEHVEDEMCLSEAYDPEHVKDETCINEAYDPEQELETPLQIDRIVNK